MNGDEPCPRFDQAFERLIPCSQTVNRPANHIYEASKLGDWQTLSLVQKRLSSGLESSKLQNELRVVALPDQLLKYPIACFQLVF